MIRARDYSIDYILKHSLIFHFILAHSAANKDIINANFLNATTNTETKYKLISVGSPIAESELRESTNAVGAELVRQVNHPYDPVRAIGSKDAALGYGLHLAASSVSEYFIPKQIMSSVATKNIIGHIASSSAGAGIASKAFGIGGIASYFLLRPIYDLYLYHPFKAYYTNPKFKIQQTIENILIENATKEINEKALTNDKN